MYCAVCCRWPDCTDNYSSQPLTLYYGYYAEAWMFKNISINQQYIEDDFLDDLFKDINDIQHTHRIWPSK